MIAFLLLVAPLPVVAASLFSETNKTNPITEEDKKDPPTSFDEPALKMRSWRWLFAARTVLVVHLWGAIVTLLPYFIYQIPNSSPTSCLLIWLMLSVFSLVGLHLILGWPQVQRKEWALLKSVTVSAAFIGLCLMSVINFATAEIGALIMVPMCLVATPFKLDVQAHTFITLLRASCNLLLVFFGFPGVAYYVMKGAFHGFDNSSVGDFWYWLESLWAWNSATYIYICTVHLPCWVLCTYIFLHSS